MEVASDSSSTRTPRGMIDQARTADPAAWASLVDLYAPLVLRWCRQSRLQDPDAADILQDVFLAVSKNLAAFRSDRAEHTFRGWLRTIVRNKVNDHFRRLRREPGGEGGTEAQLRFESLEESSDASEAEAGNERLLLRRCCELVRAEFQNHTWQAFWLTAVEGREADDVAAELGMTPIAVRVSKSRVLQRLRQALGDRLA